MSNWAILNKRRVRKGPYASTDADGFNGAFILSIPGEARSVCCIASDGAFWFHVSVSFGAASPKCPSWNVMDAVKNLFFGPDCWVAQFHPPESEYINNHPGCLHLWQPIGREFPTPVKEMVGYKELNPKV